MNDQTNILSGRAASAVRLVAPAADLMVLRGRARSASGYAAILAAVAEASKLTLADLMGPSKRREVAWPRQVAMVLCRELPGATCHSVAAALGRSDHSTVLHAEAAVAARMGLDLRAAMDRIRERARFLAPPATDTSRDRGTP